MRTLTNEQLLTQADACLREFVRRGNRELSSAATEVATMLQRVREVGHITAPLQLLKRAAFLAEQEK